MGFTQRRNGAKINAARERPCCPLQKNTTDLLSQPIGRQVTDHAPEATALSAKHPEV